MTKVGKSITLDQGLVLELQVEANQKGVGLSELIEKKPTSVSSVSDGAHGKTPTNTTIQGKKNVQYSTVHSFLGYSIIRGWAHD